MPALNDAVAAMLSTTAAPESSPLPAGEYDSEVTRAELFKANSGTNGYKVAFRVTDGPHAGRHSWLSLWLTEKAMPYTVRDLSKLFNRRPTATDLDGAGPVGVRCRIRTAVRDGYSEVKRFDVTAPALNNPFPPPEDNNP